MINRYIDAAYMVKGFQHLPVIIIVCIYGPACILGLVTLKDIYTLQFVILICILVGIYYGTFGLFTEISHWIRRYIQNISLSERRVFLFLMPVSMLLYIATSITAFLTVEVSPIGAIFRGYDWLGIAEARASYLATRVGAAALLRYLIVIFGKSILPWLVTVAYFYNFPAKQFFFIFLLLGISQTAEKGAVIFAIAPLIILFTIQKKFVKAFNYFLVLIIFIAAMSFLTGGGLRDYLKFTTGSGSSQARIIGHDRVKQENYHIGQQGNPRRQYLLSFLVDNNIIKEYYTKENDFYGRSLVILSRILWTPYMTSYDWLKFHDEIMKGEITYGDSIGLVSWLKGRKRIKIEEMVYEYEFGIPAGGAGASNTLFLVDAKLTFGWLGVLLYALIFTFSSALIFSGSSLVTKVASMLGFYTAALSSLSATFLSGGLGFFIIMSLICREDEI